MARRGTTRHTLPKEIRRNKKGGYLFKRREEIPERIGGNIWGGRLG